MADPLTIAHYAFFAVCLLLGWIAAGVLDFDGIFKKRSSPVSRVLLRIGIALVLAEGFRIFLSYAVGPLLDKFFESLVIDGFKQL